jgi:diguanylate cyclase (GGDEF)-like protein
MEIAGDTDEAYRTGGDEAVVIMRNTDAQNARKILNAFIRRLGNQRVRLSDGTTLPPLTASCGAITTTDPNESAEALRERADKAMYRAKSVSKMRDPRVSALLWPKEMSRNTRLQQ